MAGQAGDDETAMVRTYQREPHVEAQIAELTGHGLSWALDQVKLRGIGWKLEVQPEAVVHLMRKCVAENKPQLADGLVRALWEFSHWTLVRWMDRLAPDIRGEAVQDTVEDVLMEAVQAWLSDAPGHHFWEIRFFVPLRRMLLTEINRVRRQIENQTDQFVMQPSGTEVDVIDEIQASDTDPLNQIAVWNALARMNEGWARSFILVKLEGYSDQEAAQVLGVTSRTIRTYVQNAANVLKQTLLPGEADS
jgi:DNA-directed RNA polymerase specialized sigma24 family protein